MVKNYYGINPSGIRRLERKPPRISGNGFSEPLDHEICDECCLEECKKQAVKYCEEVLTTLTQFSQPREFTDSWIDGIPFSKNAKAVLKSRNGNVAEIGRLKAAFDSLKSEMLQKGKSEDGGRRSNYFAVHPSDPKTIVFVSSQVYQPFKEWLEGKQLEIDGKKFGLGVVSSRGRENALLTQGEPPTKVDSRGQRV